MLQDMEGVGGIERGVTISGFDISYVVYFIDFVGGAYCVGVLQTGIGKDLSNVLSFLYGALNEVEAIQVDTV